MTSQEAIRRIKDHNEIHSKKELDFAMYITEALNMACKALEYRTAKKLTHEATLYKCFTCPTCKNVLDEFTEFSGKKVRVTFPYCKFCGQKLDWERSI